MEFEFEKGYLVDGVPYDTSQSIPGDPDKFEGLLNDVPLSTHIGIGICSEYFGQWREALYDPQMSSVFLQPPTLNTPESPTQQKDRHIAAIVAPIVVGLVVVIIAVIIVVVIRSPYLKAKCMPSYAARESLFEEEKTNTKNDPRPATSFAEPQRASSPVTKTTEHGWRKSSRPTV